MTIKKDDLASIEKAMKIEEGTLQTAIDNDEEVEVKLTEDLVIFTKEEDETRLNNIRAESKTAGLEMGIKEKRNELDLKFEGKTLDNLLEASNKNAVDQALADAKIEPDKKIIELEGDKTKLQGTITELTDKVTGLEGNIKKTGEQAQIDTTLLSHIPENTTIPKGDIMLLFKSKHQVSLTSEGVMEISKDGEILKDDTRNPLLAKDVVTQFSDTFIKKPEGGAGGDDDPAGGAGGEGSMEAFIEEMKEKEIPANSMKFNEELQKRIKDGTLKT